MSQGESQDMSESESRNPSRDTGAALTLDRVGVVLEGRAILRGVSTTLGRGELVALLGPNGAGKTTLLRAIAGLIPATGGIAALSHDLAALAPAARARLIAYLPQGHQAHWPLPAEAIVALGRYPHGLRDPARLSAAEAGIVARAMDRADATPFRGRNIQTLSGGERARVMMARVLAVEAPILLADEPTAALDPRHQLEIMTCLRREAEAGALVIAVTHDIALAARFATRALVLAEGALVAGGAPSDVLTDALMADVYGVTMQRAIVGGQAVLMPWSAA
jgi:iron complex transport system ATP-binding protein